MSMLTPPPAPDLDQLNPAGDPELEEFVESHRDGLVRWLVASSGDVAAAQDTAQEALERTVRHWQTVRRMDHPLGWLRMVATNIMISTWRREGTGRRAVHALGREGHLRPSFDTDLHPAMIDLFDAIDRLPPMQREIVLLRHYVGCSVVETARIVGCATGTVKSSSARARRSLRANVS